MVWYLYLSDTPVSHLDTALLLTQSFSASTACVMPFASRRRLTVEPVIKGNMRSIRSVGQISVTEFILVNPPFDSLETPRKYDNASSKNDGKGVK